MNRPLILITGASGYIASALIRRLASSFTIVGLDRPGGREPVPPAIGIDCDIGADASVAQALRLVRQQLGGRVAAVVHLAAYYSFSGDDSPLYEEINVRGTERLIRALQSFEVEQFLYASTMLVHAPTAPGSFITEDSPLGPTWAYPRSKLAGEQAASEGRGRIPLAIARIAGVYDDVGHAPTLATQMQRIYERDWESHFFPGHISHGQSMIHLDDLIDCFARVIDRRQTLPAEFTVLAGERQPLNYDELQHLLGRLIHGEDWDTYQIPKLVAKAGAWIKRAIPGEDFIRPWMIERAQDHYALDTTRAQTVLGWQPKHQLRDTLPKMAQQLKADPSRWYRENKLPPPKELRPRE